MNEQAPNKPSHLLLDLLESIPCGTWETDVKQGSLFKIARKMEKKK